VGGGVDVPLGDDLVASLAYRHADLGRVETDRGPIHVIRPEGRSLIPVRETHAPLTVDEVLFSLRAAF
jgi:hypothetical protein